MLTIKTFDVRYGDMNIQSPEFSINNGDIVHVFGTSSSFASDFCLMLAGLTGRLPRTNPAPHGRVLREPCQFKQPDESLLSLNGKSPYELDDQERASQIGVVFDDPTQYFIGDTILEEFNFSFAAVGKEPPVVQALQRYGLYGKANLHTETLSGGEQHRLNIACVLELEPTLLVLDFSQCNLDTDFITNTVKWIFEKRNHRATVIYGLRREFFSNMNVKYISIDSGIISLREPSALQSPSLDEEQSVLSNLYSSRTIGDTILQVNMLHRPHVTRPVKFELHQGEILQIKGPNGIGKTTLGKILVRWLKNRNNVGGTTYPPLDRFTAFMSLQRTERFSLVGASLHNLFSDIILNECGVNDDGLKYHTLSTSKQKLLSIALVLSRSVEFAVLDEPTACMDYEDKQRLVKLLNKFPEKAVIIFTHDDALSGIGKVLQFEDIVR